MRCPTLSELPPPPPGKTGWPWTEESSQLPEKMPDGSEWPRISIVTPSYNQGQFIEETIRSVLLQGYPNLEYIIIDGASKDNTVDIIKKYKSYFAYWVSERDQGQSHAINKGISKSTGHVFTFINSDDLLSSNCLANTATNFVNNSSTFLLHGRHFEIDESSKIINDNPENTEIDFISWQDLVLSKTYLHQTGTFWLKEVFEQIGQMREDLHYTFDQDFFIRALKTYNLKLVKDYFSYARIHPQAKTQKIGGEYSEERYLMLLTHLSNLENLFLKTLAYRTLSINRLITLCMTGNTSRLEKLIFGLRNPLLLTSFSFWKVTALDKKTSIFL